MSKFVRAANYAVNSAYIIWADFSEIEQLKVRIQTVDRIFILRGHDAIEAAMLLKPSILEGRKLWWLRYRWMIHNLIGHPVMQLLAMFRQHRLALRVHDATVPRPVGKRE